MLLLWLEWEGCGLEWCRVQRGGRFRGDYWYWGCCLVLNCRGQRGCGDVLSDTVGLLKSWSGGRCGGYVVVVLFMVLGAAALDGLVADATARQILDRSGKSLPYYLLMSPL